jgi:hypothetical protein
MKTPALLAVLWVAVALSATSADAGAGGADSAARGRPRINLEGWYPPADPESSSVRLGRRTNAPLVSLPLTGGQSSLPSLGRAILAALSASAPKELLALCVTREEFETILWPEFPQSRPVTGILPIDAWRVLHNRLHSGCLGGVSDHGGRDGTLVRIEARAGVMEFRNFRLHRGVTIIARDSTGAEQALGFVRTVVERKGVFKIYSTSD